MAETPRIDVTWDEETKTVLHKAYGMTPVDLAERSAVEMKALLAQHPEAIGVLVDLTFNPGLSSDSRAVYTKFVSDSKKKCAFFGASPIMRVVATLVFTAAGHMGLMNMLSSKEEALAWLKA